MKGKGSMDGKAVVITGATSGIGFAAAQQIAGCGAFVIGIGRSQERCDKAHDLICKQNPAAHVSFLVADFSSMSEVRDCASRIVRMLRETGRPGLDALVNNAGTFASYYINTPEGFELQFAVNHLAPFLLTHELMPALLTAPEGRVATVSSNSHYGTRMNWNDLFLRKHYNCLRAYKQSKLANVLFSYELNRRMRNTSVKAFVADPGLVRTEIGLKRSTGIAKMVWSIRMKGGVAPEVPAKTITYLVTDPGVMKNNALYYKDCAPQQPSRYSQNSEMAKKLWAISEKLCGIGSSGKTSIRTELTSDQPH